MLEFVVICVTMKRTGGTQMKRILSLLLCFILLLQTGVFAFSDAKGHWAEQYALYLNEKGIFNGDDLGNANLADNIRRSEFIALLMRSLYDEEVPKGENVFDDVFNWSCICPVNISFEEYNS